MLLDILIEHTPKLGSSFLHLILQKLSIGGDVVLRSGDLRMSEHMLYSGDVYTPLVQHRRKCSSRYMCCQSFPDTAYIPDFFEICVHLLVAGNRKNVVVFLK